MKTRDGGCKRVRPGKRMMRRKTGKIELIVPSALMKVPHTITPAKKLIVEVPAEYVYGRRTIGGTTLQWNRCYVLQISSTGIKTISTLAGL
jgi:hypothetical protein